MSHFKREAKHSNFLKYKIYQLKKVGSGAGDVAL
jgi:hypothetical protein